MLAVGALAALELGAPRVDPSGASGGLGGLYPGAGYFAGEPQQPAAPIARTFTATQAQATSPGYQSARTLSVAQGQAISRREGIATTLTLSASHGASVRRTPARALTRTQAQLAATTSTQTHPGARTLTATQPQAATLAGLFTRRVTATQSQSPALRRAIARVLAATAAQAGSYVAVRARVRALILTQPQSATLTSTGGHQAKQRTLAATQAHGVTRPSDSARTFTRNGPQQAWHRRDSATAFAGAQTQQATTTVAASVAIIATQDQAMLLIQGPVPFHTTQDQSAALALDIATGLALTQNQTITLKRLGQTRRSEFRAGVARPAVLSGGVR